MHDLNDIFLFNAVVENNGFSAAGRALRVPKSSISRRVGRLEARLAVRLLERSTRSVRLTEAGSAYYSRSREILAGLEAAERDIAQLRSEPIGIIRASCPTGIAQFALARIMPGFLARYPRVRVQLLATNRPVDLIHDKVDVAIRARLRLDDEAVTMRKLSSGTLMFVASPAFIARHGIPDDPQAISALPFLSFQEDAARPVWSLTGPDGATRAVGFDPVLWTSDFSTLVEAACAGIGVALLPSEAVSAPVRDGRLVRILPAWRSEDVNIHLVFTTSRGLAPSVRAFIDYLVEQFDIIRKVTFVKAIASEGVLTNETKIKEALQTHKLAENILVQAFTTEAK